MVILRKILIQSSASFICVLMTGSCLFAVSDNDSPLVRKMHEKTLEEWQNSLFIAWRTPTEAELRAKLAKDPQWAAFYNPQIEELPMPEVVKMQNMKMEPAPTLEPASVNKPTPLPKGVYAQVVIPPGQTLPPPITNSPAPLKISQGMVAFPESKSGSLAESSRGIPTQVSAKEDLSVPFMGAWNGQFNKLIEYNNLSDGTWKVSENSLRDVPVELNLLEKGVLRYKLPDREGQAAYALNEDVLSIICDDVRIRGDYLIEKTGAGSLNLKTSRTLVEDKMRVTLEMNLIKRKSES